MWRMPRPAREEVRRFEWPCPGALLQMDTKRFARFSRPGHKITGIRDRTAKERRSGVGWEFCHSIIDDHSRRAYTELCPDEKAPTVTAFVPRALDFFADHALQTKRLQPDSAWTYIHTTSLPQLLPRSRPKHPRPGRG